MLKFLLTVSILAVGTSNAKYYWPKPSSISHFVVFDGNTGLKDIARNQWPLETHVAELDMNRRGPFGEVRTSYGVTKNEWMSYMKPYYVGTYSFTYAFYFATPAAEKDGAILHDRSLSGGEPAFNIGYRKSSLEVSSTESSGQTQSLETMDNFFWPTLWHFVALTYSPSSKTLKLYDEMGKLVKSWVNFKLGSRRSTTLVFGQIFRDNHFSHMYQFDSIACVFRYNTILSSAEISELPDVCQRKGIAPPSPTSTALPSVQPSSTARHESTVLQKSTAVHESTALHKSTAPHVKTTAVHQLTTVTPTPGSPTTPWPSPEALLGLWPLSLHTGTSDIGPNALHADTPHYPTSSTVGPFGSEDTALKITKGQSDMFHVDNSKLSTNEGSFTVSFFFKPVYSASGGLFEFIDDRGSNKAFQFRYNNLTVEASAGGRVVGQYEMVQPQSTWTFVAFAWDHPTALLTIFSQFGIFRPAELQPHLDITNFLNNHGIRVGHSTFWNQGASEGDAFACCSVYSKALSWPEVEQLIDGCRIINHESLPGQPKMPIPPIPESVGITTVPKYGQFPSIASLRLGAKHICSASILTPFWLLTSSACFAETAKPTSFTAIVGEFDLEIEESDQVSHGISKILFSGESKRDVALLQLSTPINLNNRYVAEAYVYSGTESNSMTWFYHPQFFVGWGVNGRHPVQSETLPRMVSGDFVTADLCSWYWGDAFESVGDLCFYSRTQHRDVPCSGDEGAPVYVPIKANEELLTGDRLLQVGLYYGRAENCSYGKPALFVNLAAHATWIRETIACAIPNVQIPAKCPQ